MQISNSKINFGMSFARCKNNDACRVEPEFLQEIVKLKADEQEEAINLVNFIAKNSPNYDIYYHSPNMIRRFSALSTENMDKNFFIKRGDFVGKNILDLLKELKAGLEKNEPELKNRKKISTIDEVNERIDIGG